MFLFTAEREAKLALSTSIWGNVVANKLELQAQIREEAEGIVSLRFFINEYDHSHDSIFHSDCCSYSEAMEILGHFQVLTKGCKIELIFEGNKIHSCLWETKGGESLH